MKVCIRKAIVERTILAVDQSRIENEMTHETNRPFIHGMMVPEQNASHIDRSGHWIDI